MGQRRPLAALADVVDVVKASWPQPSAGVNHLRMGRAVRAIGREFAGIALAALAVAAVLPVFASIVHASGAAFTDLEASSGNSWSSDTMDAPTALNVSGGSTVTLGWTATSDTYASGHRVLRSVTSGGPYTQIAELTPRTTVAYIDSPPAGTYYYVVRAFYGTWESVDSNEDSAIVTEPIVGLADSWQAGLSHIAGSGSDRLLVFVASNEEQASSGPSISSVSYGGQALTHAVSDEVSNGSKTARVEIWTLDESGISAAVGTTITPTWTSTPDTPLYSHAVFEEVDQATPTGASATGSATGDTPNPVPVPPVATSNHDMVIAAATAGEAGSYAPQNGFLLGLTQDTTTGGTTAHGTGYKVADGSNETASMLFNPASPPWINRQVVIALVLNVTP